MPQDQDNRPNDDTTTRPVEGAQQPPAGAVSRMLANPRRTRRA
jgi:hypothetical protein